MGIQLAAYLQEQRHDGGDPQDRHLIMPSLLVIWSWTRRSAMPPRLANHVHVRLSGLSDACCMGHMSMCNIGNGRRKRRKPELWRGFE